MFLERRHDHVASFEDEELTVPLLQQMVDCRKGELAGSVTARGLLESCKWFE